MSTPLIMLIMLLAPRTTLPQSGRQNWTLAITGQPGRATVIQINGRSYVDIEGLARLTSGSLAFRGHQIILTMSAGAPGTPTTVSAASQQDTSEFSHGFLRAGIEEMAVIREWRSALVTAVERGFPVTNDFVAGYQSQAATNLRLASVAATTESDRNAFQLLSNEFNNMQTLNDRILAERKNLSYIAPNALKNDPLDQRILACGHSLAAMAASGKFQDDGSCH
jgi:hypothetical protein